MKKTVQLLLLLLANNIAFNQAGKFDTTFSHDGKKITLFNKPTALHALALQSDGKIVAVGTIDSFFTIVRYNANGSTDKTFGNNGTVTGLKGEANAVAIQDNGRIIVAGTASKEFNYTHYNIKVARYTIHGDIDSGFGENGTVTIKIGAINICKAIVVQPDEKILLAGTTAHSYFAYTKALLVRLNTNGSYDTNFGDSGKVIAFTDNLGLYIGSSSTIKTMALQSDGKIIIGGTGLDVSGGNESYCVLMRFKRNGDLDKSFGNKGRAAFSQNSIYDIAVQSNDKIVCVGSTINIRFDDNGNYYYVTVPTQVRYTANGVLDKTYGEHKNANQIQPENIENAEYYSVALLPNDESVSTLQYVSLPNDTTLAIFKYDTKREIDSAFSNDGEKAFTMPYLQSNKSPSTPILVQPDGKIVVGCTYNSTGFYIARMLGSNMQSKDVVSAAKAIKNTSINKNNFSVYPNPATTTVTVSFNGSGNYVLKLTDANGNLLQTKNITATKGLNTVTINVSNYAAGNYFIMLMDDKQQVQTLQVSKQ